MLPATSGNDASVASAVITGATFCLTFGIQAFYKYSDTDGKDDLKAASLELDLAFSILEKLRKNIEDLTLEHGKTWLFQKVVNSFKYRTVSLKESCITTKNLIERTSLKALEDKARLKHGIPEDALNEQNLWGDQSLQTWLSTIPEAATEPSILEENGKAAPTTQPKHGAPPLIKSPLKAHTRGDPR
ncbi:hypothetical protein H0H87_001940 [Tephrocybe sp. NHM501043]|nr:hypothetical protein H0H87_001940 [Tephrocybe sp. NHM501043]